MLDLKGRGININGQYIILFANDIVNMAEYLQGLKEVFNSLRDALRLIRLKMNLN